MKNKFTAVKIFLVLIAILFVGTSVAMADTQIGIGAGVALPIEDTTITI